MLTTAFRAVDAFFPCEHPWKFPRPNLNVDTHAVFVHQAPSRWIGAARRNEIADKRNNKQAYREDDQHRMYEVAGDAGCSAHPVLQKDFLRGASTLALQCKANQRISWCPNIKISLALNNRIVKTFRRSLYESSQERVRSAISV